MCVEKETILVATKWAHGAIITSSLRQNDVAEDVVISLLLRHVSHLFGASFSFLGSITFVHVVMEMENEV